MISLVVGGLIAVGAVVLVALPFLRDPERDDLLDTPTDAIELQLALSEARDYALAALKELEFDHRTGKVDDADYRSLVGSLRRQAADALQALDRARAEQLVAVQAAESAAEPPEPQE